MAPQKLSQAANRDHIHPKSDGGEDYLHNLVITCGTCNRSKAAKNIVDFQVERGKDYLKAPRPPPPPTPPVCPGTDCRSPQPSLATPTNAGRRRRSRIM
ncbi:MAG: HNH endonuclease [Sphingomonadales bacterium]|nr:HNH endonuclease [Sphingomonadales bacterium]